MFDYVQRDLKILDELKAKFSDISPIFKNFDITRKRKKKQFWGINEDRSERKRFVKATATRIDIELQFDQRITYHTTFHPLAES